MDESWNKLIRVGALTLAIVVIVFLLASCAPPDAAGDAQNNDEIDSLPGTVFLGRAGWIRVYRFVDREYNNICYISGYSSSSSIHCLPLQGD